MDRPIGQREKTEKRQLELERQQERVSETDTGVSHLAMHSLLQIIT